MKITGLNSFNYSHFSLNLKARTYKSLAPQIIETAGRDTVCYTRVRSAALNEIINKINGFIEKQKAMYMQEFDRLYNRKSLVQIERPKLKAQIKVGDIELKEVERDISHCEKGKKTKDGNETVLELTKTDKKEEPTVAIFTKPDSEFGSIYGFSLSAENFTEKDADYLTTNEIHYTHKAENALEKCLRELLFALSVK